MHPAYKNATLKAAVGLAVLLCIPSPGFAQTGLGAAASYAVLAGSAITNTGATRVTGDVGVSPGSAITGFPFAQPTLGTVHAGDRVAAQAQIDLASAYNFLAGMPCSVTMCGDELGGRTLRPGVYRFASSARLAGTLHLDARDRFVTARQSARAHQHHAHHRCHRGRQGAGAGRGSNARHQHPDRHRQQSIADLPDDVERGQGEIPVVVGSIGWTQ